ncbi:MAG: tyrosine-type recombinase/integrase [bacterium]
MKEYKLYLKSLQARNKSKTTITNATNFISEFLELMNIKTVNDIVELKPMHFENYTTMLNNTQSSKKTKLAYIKMFMAFLEKNELITKNYASLVKVDAPYKAVKCASGDAIKSMMIQLKSSYNRGVNLSDYALTYTLFTSGVRISELLNVKLNDITDDGFYVLGKGNKPRFVELQKQTIDLLHDYIKKTNSRRTKEGFVFVSCNGNKKNRSNYNKTLKLLGEKVGITEAEISPHKLRHAYATYMLNAGVDMDIISKQLGHSNIAITSKIYAISGKERIRDAITAVQF